MVARMIFDISNQYIERQPPEKLMQSRLWITETEADRLCKILIARIARLHPVHPKHGQSGDHGTALPPNFIDHAIEPRDNEHDLPTCLGQPHWRDHNAGQGSEATCDIIAPYHR